MRKTLSWIKGTECNTDEVESYRLVVVHVIRSNILVSSPFGQVVEDCRRLIRETNKISLFCIKQSTNIAAHLLVRDSYFFFQIEFSIGYLFL